MIPLRQGARRAHLGGLSFATTGPGARAVWAWAPRPSVSWTGATTVTRGWRFATANTATVAVQPVVGDPKALAALKAPYSVLVLLRHPTASQASGIALARLSSVGNGVRYDAYQTTADGYYGQWTLNSVVNLSLHVDRTTNVFSDVGVLTLLSVGASGATAYHQFADGSIDTRSTASSVLAISDPTMYVGTNTPGSDVAQPALIAVLRGTTTEREFEALAKDPGKLFEPQRIWVPVSAGGGGATPQTLSSSLSLAVQVARSATASLGLAVQAPASATASVTLAVQQALTAQASLGTAVQLARTAAASLDTAVQTARSASTGTSLAVQAPASAVLSADIAVQQASSASASVDAYVQAATQLVASLDLLVQEGHALSVALEVAVQAARTGTSSVDLAVQAARAASTGVDTAVQQARSAAASVGLAVQAARAAGASVDLYVQAGFALVAGLDVAVRFAASAAASVDLAVATARSASVQIGAAVAVQQVLGAAMQAAVRASAVATCGVGLYVDDPAALVHSAAPLVPRVQGAARRAAVQSVIRAAAGQRTRRR